MRRFIHVTDVRNDTKCLVDFGIWSKPATIKALADVVVTAGQERASRRLMAEEGRQQENIGTITADAASQLADNAKPQEMEPDWIASFIAKARLVSDTALQSLWARILAGEATNPGSYSKRTIELLASLDRADGRRFANLCSFAVMLDGPLPLVYDAAAAVYNRRGVNIASLQHLESVRLINFSQRAGFVMQGLRGSLGLSYFGRVFRLRARRPPLQDFKLGDVTFTKSGKQLFAVYDSRPEPCFPAYLRDRFRSFGYEVLASPRSEWVRASGAPYVIEESDACQTSHRVPIRLVDDPHQRDAGGASGSEPSLLSQEAFADERRCYSRPAR